jgi:hypothetical protein
MRRRRGTTMRATLTSHVNVSPIDRSPVDDSHIDTSPVDACPIDTNPIDACPVDTSPVDACPVDTNPVDDGHDVSHDDQPTLMGATSLTASTATSTPTTLMASSVRLPLSYPLFVALEM